MKPIKFNPILNCVPSLDMEENWGAKVAKKTGVLKNQAPPKSVDLRENSWWPIGDQGNTGSCVGWALADGVLRWHFVKAGLLPLTTGLSVRQVWMSAKETDRFDTNPTAFIEEAGTSLKAALKIARKHGVVTETELPMVGDNYQDTEQTFYAIAAQRRINTYIDLGSNLKNWRKWLAQNGPILARLDVDSTFDNASDTKGLLSSYKAHPNNGGHAVSVVGYTKKHFIIRNSWGTSWGDGGYAYATNDYAKAAFTELYGVTL